MEWGIMLVAAAAVAVSLAWWRKAGRRAGSNSRRHIDDSADHHNSVHGPWQAVSIARDIDGCDAVTALGGKRFLAREAPQLPLPECDAAHCNCRYEYHEDRREGSDRRALRSASIREMDELGMTHERGSGRRKDDRADGQ